MFSNSLAKRYFANESGQVAAITAVLAVPLMLGVSIAMDSNLTDRHRTRLQSALDNAALAAISDQTLSPAARNAHAEDRFWANISSENTINFQVVSSEDNKIELEAQMTVPTLFAGIIGRDTVDLKATAAAELVKGSTVCMLALDPDSGRSFEVTQGATLDANCTIQVNSLHKQASVVDHGGQARAESFCIGGGVQGPHFPFVNTECSTLGDPYQTLDLPLPTEACIDQNKLIALTQDWRSVRDAVENHEIEENQRWADALAAGQTWYPTYFEKQHLQPGNYCQGLYLEGNEFILDPGVYHITHGSLVFGLGTELIGEGVTFVLHNEVGLEIRNGSILNIKAPTSGPMEGLVIAQSLKDKSMTNATYPNIGSTITDGAKLNLLGTVYLPSHKIEFLGGSLSKTHAPATSFIAHQISIGDGADIVVSSDHAAAGIPPIQPRSDGGARLIR